MFHLDTPIKSYTLLENRSSAFLGWTVGGISYIGSKSRALGEGGKGGKKKRHLDMSAYGFPSSSMASTGLAKTV